MSLRQRIANLWKHRHLFPRINFYVLVALGRLLVPRYRFKWPQLEWWRDVAFSRYLARYGELRKMNTDRRWMLYQLLRLTEAVPGDTAECGVFRGASSYLICKANQSRTDFQRWHFIFDSFEGLSPPRHHDGSHWREGDFAVGADTVRRNLAEFQLVSLHPGWIPARFGDVADRRFSFVHVDVDLEQPTRDSIAFFYPRLEVGGILLCDDYGCTTCPGATLAVDDFLADKPEKMLSLCCGGGFLVKGCVTSSPYVLRPET